MLPSASFSNLHFETERWRLLNEANDLVSSARFVDALPCYEGVLSFGVGDSLDVFAMALCAATLLRDACGLSSNARYERLYALSLAAFHRFDELFSMLERYVLPQEEDNWTSESLFQYWNDQSMGESLYYLSRFEESIWVLTEAIEHSLTNIRAYCFRALSFSALAHYEDALNDINAVELIIRNHSNKMSIFSQSSVRLFPTYKSLVLAASCSESKTTEGFMDELTVHLAPSAIQARDSSILSWTNREKVDGNFIRLSDALFQRAVESKVRLYQQRHDSRASASRSVLTDLGNCRSKLDALVEFYMMTNTDNFVDSTIQETGFTPEMMALRQSDAFKSFSFAGYFSEISQMDDVAPTNVMLGNLLCSEEGDSIIICYHLIPAVEYAPSDVIVRWVISLGRIIHVDTVNCSAIIRSESLATVVSLLSNSLSDESSSSPQQLREWLVRAVIDDDDDDDDEGRSRCVSFSSEDQIRNCCLLYDLLLAGLESFLPPFSSSSSSSPPHITFIPDGLLFRVPFNCLMDKASGKYLIEQFSVSVSCSLWMMQKNAEQKTEIMCSEHRLLESLICVSRSPLPSIEENVSLWKRERKSFRTESERVLRLMSSELSVTLTNNFFTPPLFSSICSQFHPQIVHVISHGSARDPSDVQKTSLESCDILYEFDMKGALLCSNSECLLARTVAEEIDLKGTELVYLSCCSLGDGDLSSGSLLGFYRACFKAGCPSIICSLWPVLSDISSRLSMYFYRFWKRKHRNKRRRKRNKARTLRIAILKLLAKYRRGGGTRRRRMPLRDLPAVWASFQLFGNRF